MFFRIDTHTHSGVLRCGHLRGDCRNLFDCWWARRSTSTTLNTRPARLQQPPQWATGEYPALPLIILAPVLILQNHRHGTGRSESCHHNTNTRSSVVNSFDATTRLVCKTKKAAHLERQRVLKSAELCAEVATPSASATTIAVSRNQTLQQSWEKGSPSIQLANAGHAVATAKSNRGNSRKFKVGADRRGLTRHRAITSVATPSFFLLRPLPGPWSCSTRLPHSCCRGITSKQTRQKAHIFFKYSCATVLLGNETSKHFHHHPRCKRCWLLVWIVPATTVTGWRGLHTLPSQALW